MVGRSAPRRSKSPQWNPGKFAVWSERWADPKDNQPTTLLLRHPTAPFTAPVKTISDRKLQEVAFTYLYQANALESIQPRLELPKQWLEALRPGKASEQPTADADFGWLPIRWPPPKSYRSRRVSADPFASFRVERLPPKGKGGKLPDQTVILMACDRANRGAMGSEFGIRVVAHVHERQVNRKTEYQIRITGMSASLPYGDFRTAGLLSTKASDRTKARSLVRALLEKRKIGPALAPVLKDARRRGLRVARAAGNTWTVEWRGTGVAKDAIGKTPAYAFVATERVTDDGSPIGRPSVIKVPLVADAKSIKVRVFEIDPASQGDPEGYRERRPTRSEEMLDHFRKPRNVNNPLKYGNPESMRVVVSPGFVRADRNKPPGVAKVIYLSGGGPPIRSNDLAAVNAFAHVEDFFRRLEAYGIDAHDYFRLAKLPLKVAYRSGIVPGPGKDGKVVNARVMAEGWPRDLAGPIELGERPSVELHLAMANLSHRAREPWNRKDPAPVEPLGIAADARWIWHEIGHVLLVATVGELEFRFAHSAGDALAAIATDPRSELAKNAEWRGLTFPWVFVPRRHDRCVLYGWSWGGSLHRALSLAPKTGPNRRKGYWSEQILSSSLFRLYLCLGGDTRKVGKGDFADSYWRERASHYVVYLIMGACQIFGTAGVVLGNKPDDLVSALIDADVGTGQWNVTYPAGGDTFLRTGGCAHKVIRWAFEAQGLYAPAGAVTNAPGLPPPVDVYIADRRPQTDATPWGVVEYGRGAYVPVSLDWNPAQKGSDPDPPLWQADANAIQVQGSSIRVEVGNRGSQPAANVRVRVWFRAWPKGTQPPAWENGLGWTSCTPQVSAGKTIGAGASETFGPFTHTPPAKRYLVLAQATCDDDPANTDAATALPCSLLKTELRDLVACDNNLGLRVLKNP